jgi:DNA invertase Pin-like site-specific DNA recombinase
MVAKKINSGDGKRIGYVRVSSADQNDARQLDGVALDKTFTDKASCIFQPIVDGVSG